MALPIFTVVSLDGAHCAVETFLFTPENGEPPIRWNVSYAKQLVAAGYYVALKPVDRETMQQISERNSWDPAHVETVDETTPGIAAPYLHEGTLIYILIDGIHRCVKALRKGTSFHAYLLSYEAETACVMGHL